MKISSYLLLVLMSLGTASAQPSPPEQAAPEKSTSAVNEETPPKKSERATGIIGMIVRDQNGEHIGQIKDIVFDLKTDRVAYVVLSASHSGLHPFKEKFLAVPMNAFTPGHKDKTLILSVDKEKLAAAKGLEEDNWPKSEDLAWGKDNFWRESGK